MIENFNNSKIICNDIKYLMYSLFNVFTITYKLIIDLGCVILTKTSLLLKNNQKYLLVSKSDSQDKFNKSKINFDYNGFFSWTYKLLNCFNFIRCFQIKFNKSDNYIDKKKNQILNDPINNITINANSHFNQFNNINIFIENKQNVPRINQNKIHKTPSVKSLEIFKNEDINSINPYLKTNNNSYKQQYPNEYSETFDNYEKYISNDKLWGWFFDTEKQKYFVKPPINKIIVGSYDGYSGLF